jgi:carbonic anhydrase/acetyltransferase-like protein (isoleucine patch superfamily)
VSVDDVASVADGVVVRAAGVGELCVLVQAASMSTLAQIRKGCFMTIESSRCDASLATNAQLRDRAFRMAARSV